MIISGQSDREMVFRSISPTHQYISKPCDADQLKSKIASAFALRDLLANQDLRAIVLQQKNIPSLPLPYLQIMEEINSKDPSLVRMAQIISQDLGMTAKVLQIVNSAYFGLRNRISTARHAVKLLGMDIVKAIVLSVHAFSQFEADCFQEPDMQWLRAHSFQTGMFARLIAQRQGSEQSVVEDAFTAGLLHDIGKLILATATRKKYAEVLKLVDFENIGLCDAERSILGCTHAEVGAYLLGAWGLPGPIVEAVAWHHNPSASQITVFSPLAAVHAGSTYHQEWYPARLQDAASLDVPFLNGLGLTDREPEWRLACKALDDSGTVYV
jgi:HD-like signal output (HDOD) protein